MRDLPVDVVWDIPVAELALRRDASEYVFDRSRAAAEALCAEHGGHLRADRAPEWDVKRGEHRITGTDVLRFGSRWIVTVPDAALVEVGV